MLYLHPSLIPSLRDITIAKPSLTSVKLTRWDNCTVHWAVACIQRGPRWGPIILLWVPRGPILTGGPKFYDTGYGSIVSMNICKRTVGVYPCLKFEEKYIHFSSAVERRKERRAALLVHDPLAMPMYALATLLLIHRVNESVTQVWYADDATATGSMEALRTWWDDLVSYGPQYGYHVNTSKTWLITKEEHHAEAAALFQDTSVNITTDGKPHLGAALGTKSYVDDFVQIEFSHGAKT